MRLVAQQRPLLGTRRFKRLKPRPQCARADPREARGLGSGSLAHDRTRPARGQGSPSGFLRRDAPSGRRSSMIGHDRR